MEQAPPTWITDYKPYSLRALAQISAAILALEKEADDLRGEIIGSKG